MILEAAEYGENPTGSPPPEVEMVLQIRRWGALPEAGGLLDQPAGLMRRLAVAENVYTAYRELSRDPAYAERNPWALEIMADVEKMRKHG